MTTALPSPQREVKTLRFLMTKFSLIKYALQEQSNLIKGKGVGTPVSRDFPTAATRLTITKCITSSHTTTIPIALHHLKSSSMMTFSLKLLIHARSTRKFAVACPTQNVRSIRASTTQLLEHSPFFALHIFFNKIESHVRNCVGVSDVVSATLKTALRRIWRSAWTTHRVRILDQVPFWRLPQMTWTVPVFCSCRNVSKLAKRQNAVEIPVRLAFRRTS